VDRLRKLPPPIAWGKSGDPTTDRFGGWGCHGGALRVVFLPRFGVLPQTLMFYTGFGTINPVGPKFRLAKKCGLMKRRRDRPGVPMHPRFLWPALRRWADVFGSVPHNISDSGDPAPSSPKKSYWEEFGMSFCPRPAPLNAKKGLLENGAIS